MVEFTRDCWRPQSDCGRNHAASAFTRSSDVPFVSAAATNTDRLTVDGIEVEVTAVSTGNPHGVVLVDNVSNLDVATLGRQLSTHSAFPYQANIGFCQVVDRGFIRLQYTSEGGRDSRLWYWRFGRRGCSPQSRFGQRKVKVSLPGGKLRIHWSGPGQPITMAGGATLVYTGEVDLKE
ncbi:MAG: hypothetical protein CM15mP68_6520 [Pseudomonadota bacterium]|nr:MAG: hypothetical protein CM15mP68_6520 [Pseudomonadota bacterium]